MGIEWAPFLIFGAFVLFLIIRAYFRYKLHASALEKGLALPETPKDKSDVRKPALVLIALGLGYSISVYTTLSFGHDAPTVAPLAASIWGIVPILIGAAMWLYWRMTEKEKQVEGRGTPPLT